MAIKRKVKLDEESLYIAVQEYLKNHHLIDIHDEATLIFPSAADSSNDLKYIDIDY